MKNQYKILFSTRLKTGNEILRGFSFTFDLESALDCANRLLTKREKPLGETVLSVRIEKVKKIEPIKRVRK